MRTLPDRVAVHVSVEGRPVSGAWTRLKLGTTARNAFSRLAGPTDSHGTCVVSGQQLERHVMHLRNQFPMDYPGLDAWDGSISVAGLDPADVLRALEAHALWGGTPGALSDEDASSLRGFSRWWEHHRNSSLDILVEVWPTGSATIAVR